MVVVAVVVVAVVVVDDVASEADDTPGSACMIGSCDMCFPPV